MNPNEFRTLGVTVTSSSESLFSQPCSRMAIQGINHFKSAAIFFITGVVVGFEIQVSTLLQA